MQFVCDFCQAPVNFKAKSCPICNTVFDKVRCPQCKFGGEPRTFKNGCPECGYSDTFMSGEDVTWWKRFWRPYGSVSFRVTVLITILVFINVILFLYVGLR